ncbi:hypothetical protein IC006_0616 [Sulfuracidifex tepidarius]|uniref:Uncharacterized protein n=1 Tax=Sulfuracidifex tepidarius TaxID=1294262 RepID=A0A510DT32_9CREN|nr:hypothetical protein IC006_0616 [Sulfuracidifex tepidarius]
MFYTCILCIRSINGKIINIFRAPFIIRQKPIIVGDTLIEMTSTDWVFAIPIYYVIHMSTFPKINLNENVTET